MGKLKEELSFLKAGSCVRSWGRPSLRVTFRSLLEASFGRFLQRRPLALVAFPRQVDPLDLLPLARWREQDQARCHILCSQKCLEGNACLQAFLSIYQEKLAAYAVCLGINASKWGNFQCFAEVGLSSFP